MLLGVLDDVSVLEGGAHGEQEVQRNERAWTRDTYIGRHRASEFGLRRRDGADLMGQMRQVWDTDYSSSGKGTEDGSQSVFRAARMRRYNWLACWEC